jgi:hypothetical protein
MYDSALVIQKVIRICIVFRVWLIGLVYIVRVRSYKKLLSHQLYELGKILPLLVFVLVRKSRDWGLF